MSDFPTKIKFTASLACNIIITYAKYFVNKHAENNNRAIPGISEEAIKYLVNYDWPGNVRQLKAAIESAIAFTDDYKYIAASALPPNILEASVANVNRMANSFHDVKQVTTF